MAIIRPKSVKVEIENEQGEFVPVSELNSNNEPLSLPTTITSISPVPDISPDLRSEADTLLSIVLSQANEIEVNSQEDDEIASEFLSTKIEAGILLLDRLFNPNIKRWHEGHKAALAEKNLLAKQFLAAKEIVKKKISEYRIQVRQKQREAISKLQEEMRQEAQESAAKKAITLLSTGKEEDTNKANNLIEKLSSGKLTSNITLPVVEVNTKSPHAPSRIHIRFEVLTESKIDDKYMITVPNLSLIQGTVEALHKMGKTFSEIEEEIGNGGVRVFEHETIIARKPKS